nr:HIT domain-containing protein [Desulfosporosinus meridiei]
MFCKLPETAILVQNDLALAFFDKFPVNEGHVLIIPKRHVVSFFDLTEEEVLGTCKLVQEVKVVKKADKEEI